MAQKKTIGVGDRAFFYEIDQFGDGGVWECRVCSVTCEGSYVVATVDNHHVYVPKLCIFDSRIKAAHAFKKKLTSILDQRLDKIHGRLADLEHDVANLRKSLCNIMVKMKEV